MTNTKTVEAGEQKTQISPWPWSLHVGEDYVRIDSKDGLNDVLPETMSVTEEHAHLFAAAPEQNQALRDILSFCNDARGHTWEELIEEVIPQIAKAAISKVEGRAQ